MSKVFFWLYFNVLIILALTSVISTWVNDNMIMLTAELFVNIVFIAGLLIFLRRKQIKYWVVPFFFACVGEIVLLYLDKETSLMMTVVWVVILMPAFNYNYRVFFPKKV